MITDNQLTPAIQAMFAEEIAARGGRVSDSITKGRLLFLRSILPDMQEVQRDDRVQGGVALKSNGVKAWVHPYVFRQVCSNGAIMAKAIETRQVVDLDSRDPELAIYELRETVSACAAPEVFHEAARLMRSSRSSFADLALNMLPMMRRFPSSLFSNIMQSFFEDDDHSAFALGNAITAAARDADDPEVRWDLEELGGGIFADPGPQEPRLRDRAERRREVADPDSLVVV